MIRALFRTRLSFQTSVCQKLKYFTFGSSNMSGKNSTFVACKIIDLEDGKMKEVENEGLKVLLIKDKERIFAISTKCTHYGASLAKGAYCNKIVRCPWHGACFNIETGDIEDYPGFDSLSTYEVTVDGNNVVVSSSPKCKDSKVDRTFSGQTRVVIVGGGAAAASCVDNLRKFGYDGKILMISAESCLPYDRPKLSKALGIDPTTILLKDASYYDRLGVQTELDCRVTDVNIDTKSVIASNGREFKYDKLILATGGQPRKLNVPGMGLKNVFVLRTPQDGKNILDQIVDKHVVILGSSFIGMEIASVIIKKEAASLTVVSDTSVPFERAFGVQMGSSIMHLFEKNNVKFKMNSGAEELKSDDSGSVVGIKLKGVAEILPCDVCIVGVGVQPATDYLKNSGVKLNQFGFVEADKFMRTNVKDIFVAGDIATFPLSILDNQIVNVQHWQMALKHGKTIAQYICGIESPVHTVPFFWTAFFGKSIRYAGYNANYDEISIHGSVESLAFVAYFLKVNRVVAVATCGKDPVASQLAELLRNGVKISKSDIDGNSNDDWLTHCAHLNP